MMNVRKLVFGQAKQFREDVRIQTAAALGAAFAFVIALSWNDFIKEGVISVNQRMGLAGDSLYLKFATLLFVTLICIIGIKLASSWGAKKEGKQ